jgi:hypothetical protein
LADLIGAWWRLRPLLYFGRFQAVNFRAHFIKGGAEVVQDVGSYAFALHHQAEQYVLGSDIVVPHASRFFEGQFDHFLDPRRRDDLLNNDSLVATQH